MKQSDLSEGMVVKLTSGGPQMTVENFERKYWMEVGENGPVNVDCVWFQDGVIKRATFNSSLLQKA